MRRTPDRRVARRPRAAAAGVAGALALLGAALAGAAPGPDLERGRRVYEARCYFCHGYSGDARTVASGVLVPPPRDFTAEALPRERMLRAVRDGRPGTAMRGFAGLLEPAEQEAVVDYIRVAFMGRGAGPHRARPATGYHTPANGWAGDPRRSPAAAFVTGRNALSRRPAELSAAERAGRRLFLASCATCHAPGAGAGALEWRNEAVSYPQGNYVEHEDGAADPVTGVFERHERGPALPAGRPELGRGEALYRRDCAHCHAEDGSAGNWIGRFLDPPPPDFRRPAPSGSPTRALEDVVREGVAGTSMPAFGAVLEASDLAAVLAYLRAAFPRFGTGAPAAAR